MWFEEERDEETHFITLSKYYCIIRGKQSKSCKDGVIYFKIQAYDYGSRNVRQDEVCSTLTYGQIYTEEGEERRAKGNSDRNEGRKQGQAERGRKGRKAAWECERGNQDDAPENQVTNFLLHNFSLTLERMLTFLY